MTTLLELPTPAKFLYGVLNVASVQAHFGSRIYRGSLAPQGATLPYLLFFQQVGVDAYTLPALWTGARLTYFVKGVAAPGAYQSVLKPGLAAVSAALDAKTLVGTTVDGFVFTVLGADTPREYEELTPGGLLVVHLGRAWELAVDPA